MEAADIERDAQDMIAYYGDSAVHIARIRVEIAAESIRNERLAQHWRNVADAIERLSVKPDAR